MSKKEKNRTRIYMCTQKRCGDTIEKNDLQNLYLKMEEMAYIVFVYHSKLLFCIICKLVFLLLVKSNKRLSLLLACLFFNFL